MLRRNIAAFSLKNLCKTLYSVKRYDKTIISNPDNGSVSTVGGDQFLAEANYSCISGFELRGCSHRSCLSTGLWSGDAPTCVETGRAFLETREILISYSKFDHSFFQSTKHRQNEITVYYLYSVLRDFTMFAQ